MIFTYIESCTCINKVDKWIEIETNNESSYTKCIDELETLNISDQLNPRYNSNIQENYETFSYLVNYAKELHLSKKMVKYNKTKHKKCKWMTDDILKSINTRDKLYKRLVQTDLGNCDLYNRLKNEYKTFRATLRRSIREAKRLYYMKTFNLYKNDIKKLGQ